MFTLKSSATKRIAVCALLIAIGAILGTMFRIPLNLFGTYAVKITLDPVAVFLAAMLFGPVYGGIVGAAIDILQIMIAPIGAYVPWFTITALLTGVIPGLFFMKSQKVSLWKIFIAIAVTQAITSVIMNTVLLNMLYALPFEATLIARLITQSVMVPIVTFITFVLHKALVRAKIITAKA